MVQPSPVYCLHSAPREKGLVYSQLPVTPVGSELLLVLFASALFVSALFVSALFASALFASALLSSMMGMMVLFSSSAPHAVNEVIKAKAAVQRPIECLKLFSMLLNPFCEGFAFRSIFRCAKAWKIASHVIILSSLGRTASLTLSASREV